MTHESQSPEPNVTPESTPETTPPVAETPAPAESPAPVEAPAAPVGDDEAPSTEFAQALEAHEKSAPAPKAEKRGRQLHAGLKVKGKVVSVGEESVLVDIGERSEAVVETQQFRGEDGALSVEVGQELELFVAKVGDPVQLATTYTAKGKGRGKGERKPVSLQPFKDALESGMPVSGKVTGKNSGGLLVDIGARGFCPSSQIELGFCSDTSSYVGKTLEFLVQSVDESRGSVVLSRRNLLRRTESATAQERVAAISVGDELEGRVRRLEAFGAFIDLGGVDGLVHVSEIRHDRLGHPKEALKEGESVRVRVLRVESGKDGKPRVALSIKAITNDPWTSVAGQFTPGQKVTGTVARLAEFGAFVTLAPGIDGLVHISAIAPHRIEKVKDALSVGQEVRAMVLAVEPEKKRISLSIKDADADSLPEPRAPRAERGERGPRPERGGAPRGDRGGDRGERRGPREGGRGGRDRGERAPAFYSTPDTGGETTMARALRLAREAAARKNG